MTANAAVLGVLRDGLPRVIGWVEFRPEGAAGAASPHGMSYRITDRGRPAPVHDEPPEDRTPVMVRPSWLASVQNSLAGWVTHRGVAAVVAAVEALIGVVAFSRKAVTVSAVAGFGLLLAIWVIGQDFGQIYGGQATDPNTGVIAIVVAVGLLPLRRRRARREFDEGAC